MQPSNSKIAVICPNCNVTNRVDLNKAANSRPICGRCKTPLEPRAPGFPVIVTDASFEREVVRLGIPVLVDFWSPTCGPCRALAPILEQLAREYAGKLRVAKINVQENQYTAAKHQIRAVPTLLLYRGIEVDRMAGAADLETLRNFVARYVK